MAEHITNSSKISKEPWEMTEKEFESLPWEATEKYVRIYWHGGLRMKRVPFHRVFVKEALEEGKPVPEKVLKDYPELKKKYTQHFKGGNNPMARMEQGLRLFNVDLPDPIPENAIEMIELAQKIHRDANARRKKITMSYEWDEYWVNAYSAVFIKLKEISEKEKYLT